MDVNKESEVKKFIDEKEKTEGVSNLFEITADLVGLEKETKEGILSNWLKNDKNLLDYAELTMKAIVEDGKIVNFNFGERLKYRLLELKLGISCLYFEDFKDFLQELKRGTDTSTDDANGRESAGAVSSEATSESSETSTPKFCGTNVSSIRSEPYEKNSKTGVTWCSKTARENGKNFGLVLPSGNAYDAGKLPGRDSIQTIPKDKVDKQPQKTWKGIEASAFKAITKGNYADLYVGSKSDYGHRAAAFRDDSGQWYVLDPYVRVNGKLDNSPKKLEDYINTRKIVKAHIYESRGYVGEAVEAMNGNVEKAVQWAIDIAEDNCYGYEWGGRGKNDRGKGGYDCASLVCTAFKNAGFDIPITGCGPMQQNFEKEGFEWISPYDVNNLQRGDILLDKDKHTELYIGNGRTVGAHSDKDGKDGDSGGNEISETNGKYFLYQYHKEYGRDGVLRYKGKK